MPRAVFTTPSFEFIMNIPRFVPQFEIAMGKAINLIEHLEPQEASYTPTESIILIFNRDADGVYRYVGYKL